MKVLFVNACVREQSRTKILADYLLQKIGETPDIIDLAKDQPRPFNQEMLLHRSKLIGQQKFDDPIFLYASKFIEADVVVIAAPYWDFSFPALLKTFVEHINVGGLVFKYDPNGRIVSLCKAQRLYYVTTMGGHNPTDFGFGYIKALCETLYNIKKVDLIKAEGLDIIGTNVEDILQKAKNDIDKLF